MGFFDLDKRIFNLVKIYRKVVGNLIRAKPKILYIVEAMGGGVFTYIVDLANNLIDSYDISIAYAVRPQTPQNFKEYFDERINLIEVKNFTRSIGAIKDIKAFLEIKQIFKQINPDIIHLHSSKAGVLGRWAFNGHKIPIFYTPHGYSFLMEDCKSYKRMLFQIIETISAKRNCTTISCSIGEHKETIKMTSRATYVSNGINQNELDKLLSQVPEDAHPFTVFTIGRICYQKNPELFNRIAESMPDIQFLWIGDGELRNELKAPNIRITGWVERGKALELAQNTDVFLLTSLWEGLPMSLLEAMYMKKICVVSDVIGNHDVIHNDVNGYVCRKVEEFKQAIIKCKNLDNSVLVERAYCEVIEEYNTRAMVKKYSNIYKQAKTIEFSEVQDDN
ncbi:glycosyltransferase [Turicibacter bilis]|uniref:Glycosyltransferase n=1 Tax=Turicibacter bilis TaxID=2735723 RepID=A0A9Q9FG29_9FIRM|nr:glycosyltransferase [Turicibacter bilis]UUF08351.1 glycosyltransferase [Turicibacter bilis]